MTGVSSAVDESDHLQATNDLNKYDSRPFAAPHIIEGRIHSSDHHVRFAYDLQFFASIQMLGVSDPPMRLDSCRAGVYPRWSTAGIRRAKSTPRSAIISTRSR